MQLTNFREWAEYYYNNNLAVLPSTVWSMHAIVESLKGRYSQKDLQDFRWEDSKSVNGIIGINDIIVLELDFEVGESAFIYKVVSRYLELLNLSAYPWVLHSYYNEEEGAYERVQIIVQCPYRAEGRQGYETISIIWSGFFNLPFDTKRSSSSVHFYFHALPLIKPKTIDYRDILNAVAKLIDEFGLFLNKNKEDTPR